MKVAFIEAEKRSSTKCPYCSYNKVKRLASGIWFCNKCHTKFTGKAYSISREIKFEGEKSKTEERPERAEAERVEMAKQKRAGKTTALTERAGEEE